MGRIVRAGGYEKNKIYSHLAFGPVNAKENVCGLPADVFLLEQTQPR